MVQNGKYPGGVCPVEGESSVTAGTPPAAAAAAATVLAVSAEFCRPSLRSFVSFYHSRA